jgi:hypothetical protein
MKTLFISIIIFLIASNLHSQDVYFGYSSDSTLKKGDIIIINVPDNIDGRFNRIEDFDKLINLISSNPSKYFRIEINIFLGSSDFSFDYSMSLCNDLMKIINRKISLNNYDFKNNGRSNPIFLNKDDPKFRIYNTRIEIFIE